MWLTELRQRWLSQPRKAKPAPRHRARRRLRAQALENRLAPAVFNAASVADFVPPAGS